MKVINDEFGANIARLEAALRIDRLRCFRRWTLEKRLVCPRL